MAGQSPMEKIKAAGRAPLASQLDKGRGRALTLASLIRLYDGDVRKAKDVYYRAAVAGGFGDFRGLASGATPDLDLAGLDNGRLAAVEAILSEAPPPAEEAAKE